MTIRYELSKTFIKIIWIYVFLFALLGFEGCDSKNGLENLYSNHASSTTSTEIIQTKTPVMSTIEISSIPNYSTTATLPTITGPPIPSTSTEKIRVSRVLLKDLGKGLYYVYWKGGYYYVVSLTDSEEYRLSFPFTNEPGSAISRNSEEVVFVDSEDKLSLYDISSESINTIPLASEIWGASHPQWSPNNEDVVFDALNEQSDGFESIYVTSLPENKTIMLTSWPGSEINPKWSPDGKRIAFTSDHLKFSGGPGYHKVYLMEADCQNQPDTCMDRIDPIGNIISGASNSVSWSPDSHRVAISCSSQGFDSICIIDIQKFELEKTYNVEANFIATLDWSPDGEYIAYTECGPQSFCRIVVMTADNGEVLEKMEVGKDIYFAFWFNVE